MLYVDDDDIALLARRGVAVTHCPSAALKHVKGLGVHGRFPEMLAAGVSVSLGRDSANGSNHFDMLRLMYLAPRWRPRTRGWIRACCRRRRCSRWRRSTAPARFGLESEIGSLEPGKRADLVLFDLDRPEWRPLLDPVSNLVY